MRCYTMRSRCCNFGLFKSCPSMFLDTFLELFLLVMQGIVSLIPPGITDSTNEVLSIVQEKHPMVLELLLLVKQLTELPSGLPVPFEGRNLRALEKMGLVRAENFQLSSGPHHRSPPWRRCSGRSGSGWGRAHNCGVCRSGKGARLITDVWMKHVRSCVSMVRVMDD